MRIIAGSARGRALAGPRHPGLRPTSDRARQVLFDLLGQRFDGGAVLDLYCGSGALALEALSRGASEALCVDADKRAIELTLANATATGLGRVEVRKLALPAGLGALPVTARRLVFADPPYDVAANDGASVLRWADGVGVLALEGVLAIETSIREPLAAEALRDLERLELFDRRRVGEALLQLFRPSEAVR